MGPLASRVAWHLTHCTRCLSRVCVGHFQNCALPSRPLFTMVLMSLGINMRREVRAWLGAPSVPPPTSLSMCTTLESTCVHCMLVSLAARRSRTGQNDASQVLCKVTGSRAATSADADRDLAAARFATTCLHSAVGSVFSTCTHLLVRYDPRALWSRQ